MIVIEERRSFLEKNLRDGLFQTLPHDQARRDRPRSTASDSPATPRAFPTARLNYSVLAQKLIPLIQATDEIPGDMRNGRLTAGTGSPAQASRRS
jgi:indolepyruvate ferredoxin oxidoreductase